MYTLIEGSSSLNWHVDRRFKTKEAAAKYIEKASQPRYRDASHLDPHYVCLLKGKIDDPGYVGNYKEYEPKKIAAWNKQIAGRSCLQWRYPKPEVRKMGWHKCKGERKDFSGSPFACER